jgi:hypothetical protein
VPTRIDEPHVRGIRYPGAAAAWAPATAVSGCSVCGARKACGCRRRRAAPPDRRPDAGAGRGAGQSAVGDGLPVRQERRWGGCSGC